MGFFLHSGGSSPLENFLKNVDFSLWGKHTVHCPAIAFIVWRKRTICCFRLIFYCSLSLCSIFSTLRWIVHYSLGTCTADVFLNVRKHVLYMYCLNTCNIVFLKFLFRRFLNLGQHYLGTFFGNLGKKKQTTYLQAYSTYLLHTTLYFMAD